MSLDQRHKAMVLPWCLPLIFFDSVTATVIIRFITSAIRKMYKLRLERLHELGANTLVVFSF